MSAIDRLSPVNVVLKKVAVNAKAMQLQPGRPLPAWAIGPFERPPESAAIVSPTFDSSFDCPMRGTPVRWEALHTFNPAAIVRGGKVYLLYRAEDDFGEMAISAHTSRLGLAVSEDGITFQRYPAPVVYPAEDSQKPTEWDGGCEDPRLVEAPDGSYVLTYTQWDRRVPRLAIATSDDLHTWVKHGPAFNQVHGEKYNDLHSKAGSIVCERTQDDRLVAVKISGKYWMYWGEHTIRLAWSTDLINWNMVEDAAGEPTVVLNRRPGQFDSPLVEPGPPALLTEDGIILIYNARNDGCHDHAGLDCDAYSAGQALFDPSEPTRLIGRLDEPFIRPEMPFECRGQYGAGTTFTEGLVRFNNRWFLYYGCADSLVAVAVSPTDA